MRPLFGNKGFGFAILLILLLVLNACSPTRNLTENQALLDSYRIKGLKGKQLDDARSYVRQKPNRAFLGIKFLRVYLGIYNLADRGEPRKYKEALKNIGEAPVIYDSTLTEYSARQINSYLFSKGYFQSSVRWETRIKKKRARVTYFVDEKLPWSVRYITFNIPDTAIKDIHFNDIKNSQIRQGMIYDANALQDERSRITALLKNNGYYFFNREYIFFQVDSNIGNHQIDINVIIENLNDSTVHQSYKLNNITVSIDPSRRARVATMRLDTMQINEYKLILPPRQFNPRIILQMIYLKRNELYRSRDLELTYNRLGDLGVFKFINIQFQVDPKDSARLDCYINLTPNKRLGLKSEAEAFVNSENPGTAANLTYTNRNIFRGAELFEFKVKGALETQTFLDQQTELPLFNSTEFSVSTALFLPRFLFLPALNTSSRYGSPKTRIALNYSYINRPEYQRNTLNTSLSYEYKQTRFITHIYTPVDISFVTSILSDDARETLRLLNNRFLLESFREHVSLGGKYTFISNTQEITRPKDYTYVKLNFEIAGTSLYAFNQIAGGDQDADGTYRVVGLPYYQYVRPDFDIRRYELIDVNNAVVLRINGGFGFAYLNSEILPFEKQFYIGGSNSLRAWRARELGPGTVNSISTTETNTVFNLDQTGDMKLEGSLEYRFDIFDRFFAAALKGATFLDAGNIWTLNKESAQPGSEFSFSDFTSELALGTGVGLRMDYQFFIFRFDIGLKLYDPRFPLNERWVIHKFNDEAWKDTYDYSFLNMNFGIGYPF